MEKKLEKLLSFEKKRIARIEKPENIEKSITVVIDSRIIDLQIGTQIMSSMQSASISVCERSLQSPNLIQFERNLENAFIRNDQICVSSSVFTYDECVYLIVSKSHLNELCLKLKNCTHATTIIFWPNVFIYKDLSSFLLANPNLTVRALDTAHQILAYVTAFIRSLSRKSIRQANMNATPFSWCSDSKSSRVFTSSCADGETTSSALLWMSQLRQVPGCCNLSAQAICDRYDSPLALIAAYRSTASEDARANLLADLRFIRGEGGLLQSSRRIGTELSHKIYRIFCSPHASNSIL